jgi:hypothetical protein
MPFIFPDGSNFARHPDLPMSCTLANNTSISGVFEEIGERFDALFRKRAFISWYSDMEVDEFIEARSAFGLILDTYNLKNVRLPPDWEEDNANDAE